MRWGDVIEQFRSLSEPVAPHRAEMVRVTCARVLEDQLSRILFFLLFCVPAMVVAGLSAAIILAFGLIASSEIFDRTYTPKIASGEAPVRTLDRLLVHAMTIIGSTGYAIPGPILAASEAPALMVVGFLWLTSTMFHLVANYETEQDIHHTNILISAIALVTACLLIGVAGVRPSTTVEHSFAAVAAALFAVHLWTLFQSARRTMEKLEALKAAERRRAEQAAHAAAHDGLTGLPNRIELERRLKTSLAEPAADVAVLLIDMDGFKPVNDTHGHATGDALLQRIALRLRRVVRAPDLAARIGGDEFVVAARGLDAAGAHALADRIATALARPYCIAGAKIKVGASVGVALRSGVCDNATALIASADQAMYVVKRRRKTAQRAAGETPRADAELETT